MAKRGPYKQKADIPPPIGAQESIRLHWDIMINHPDRGERRAAKKLLRKMGVDQAANVDVDRKVPVMHPTKFKRKQTEAQRARSEAFFNRYTDTPPPASNSSVGSPQAAVEGTESNPEGNIAVQHINTSTAGKGYQGDWFNFPLPIPDASRPAPQPQGTLTIEQARAQGLPVKFAGDVGVWMYRKEHGAKFWTACVSAENPAAPPVRRLPTAIDQLYGSSRANPAQSQLEQLRSKFPGNETRVAPYGEGSKDTAQVLLGGCWVSYDWCKANGKL